MKYIYKDTSNTCVRNKIIVTALFIVSKQYFQ